MKNERNFIFLDEKNGNESVKKPNEESVEDETRKCVKRQCENAVQTKAQLLTNPL